jgi:hypothetical protein
VLVNDLTQLGEFLREIGAGRHSPFEGRDLVLLGFHTLLSFLLLSWSDGKHCYSFLLLLQHPLILGPEFDDLTVSGLGLE